MVNGIKRVLFFYMLLILSSCSGKKINENIYDETYLDNIKEVPEWLKMNVDEALPSDSLNIWIPTNNFQTSSLIRVPRFPRKFSTKELERNEALQDFVIRLINKERSLELTAVKNEQVSAQIVLGAKKNIHNARVKVSKLSNLKGDIIDAKNVQVRYVKFLPVERSRSEYVWSPKLEEIIGEGVSGNMAPSVVGDPLVEATSINIPAYRAQPIWFTIKVPKNIAKGVYEGTISISADEYKEVSYSLKLHVLNKVIPDPKSYKFHLDMWVNISAIADYYKIEYWSKKHWELIEKYLKEYASRGGKNIAVTITHEPWHKPWMQNSTTSQSQYGYKSMVKWIKTKEGNWEFDYSIFDAYVDMATKLGINEAINAYSLAPFLTNQKIHFYDKKTKDVKILEMNIEDKLYKVIWSRFLKDFKKHLLEKGIFERVYLGFDEKPDEELHFLLGIIKEAAPEFLNRIIVAGHPEGGKNAENLSIAYDYFPGQRLEKKDTVLSTITHRNQNNKITTFYLCASPSHPNTLSYSPAIESQLIPWLALKYNTNGYLRWAFNNWTDNPFKKPVFIHAQGDDYQIYPGEEKPVSSIRWELLKEGIEDYELFRIVKEEGNIPDELLQEAVEIATRNQDGRYKRAKDITQARNLILKKN